MQVNELYFQNVGQRLQKAGNSISVITSLLHENQIALDHEEGDDTFNGYVTGGLLNALELLSGLVVEIGSNMEDMPAKIKQAGV